MGESRTILQDLALVFCVATVATIVVQRLRLPAVLGYLLAGLVVGPHVPIPLFADVQRIELLSELGVILVIFSIGLDFRLDKLVKVLPTAGVVGALQVPGMLWVGYTIGRIAGWSGIESLFLGGAVCISSTMIVARVLGTRKDDKRVKDNVFGILVVQDLAAIVLISVLTAVAGGAGMPAADVAWLLGELGLSLVLAVVAGILIVPRLIREADHQRSPEVLLVAAIGTCFGMALLAEYRGYSVALGAFIAGSLIAESGRRRRVEHLLGPVRDLFAAVFFVSIGMLVDPTALADNWVMIAVVSAAILCGQSAFITVGSLLSGASVGVAVRSALSLAQIGEFSFIIVGVGVSARAIPDRLMAIAVGVAVVTTFLTPFLVAGSLRVATAIEGRLPRPVQTFVALYGSWLESVRGHRPKRGFRHTLPLMLLDVVVISALSLAVGLGRHRLAGELSAFLGVPIRAAGMIVIGAALAIALPFVIGLARTVQRLVRDFAVRVLPHTEAGVDLADAPRRALIVALQVAVALAAVIPLVALTQPFVPLYVGALVLVVVVGGLGILFWRRASNLQGHMRAGAELVLEVLDKQRHADEDEAGAPELPQMLPGLGPLVSVELPEDSRVAGKTLAEINLRALTGATVVAIRRAGGEGIGMPSGHERLSAGDVVILTGSTACCDRALRLLAGES